MTRIPQSKSSKGSQYWLQKLACPNSILTNSISSAIGVTPESLEWLSPLPTDEYAEYRDEDFINLLGIELHKPLKEFWPRNGPQWDGLARSGSKLILIEAKAHLDELASPRCGAKQKSYERITRSLLETQLYMSATPKIEWTGTGYQYANRLAHLYFLRCLNNINAQMVFVNFANDPTVTNPVSECEWEGAIRFMNVLLGMRRNRLSKFIHHIVIDVSKVEPDAT
ncbi:MAG: hypothetical protein JNK90_07585 [Planctomycetaceae bacterium]|nr:hypothetical protein [Planctomycetaceae bacterium]